ncbi:hypothetical protein TNCV_2691221 [Trichonephila clavipes]|uniref:Uncharacterized protein n=1 Tax=Trichonephila clavipes TaxID=2585209 RepID=A0A8X7BAB2_TRICX|nr:hypothetical protein TNCV_2691221 [Trichonephila clavipes]
MRTAVDVSWQMLPQTSSINLAGLRNLSNNLYTVRVFVGYGATKTIIFKKTKEELLISIQEYEFVKMFLHKTVSSFLKTEKNFSEMLAFKNPDSPKPTKNGFQHDHRQQNGRQINRRQQNGRQIDRQVVNLVAKNDGSITKISPSSH